MTVVSSTTDVTVGNGDIDVTHASSQVTNADAPAESSTANEGAKEPVSALEAVKEALKKTEPEPEQDKADGKSEESPTEEGKSEKAADESKGDEDEEDSKLPFHKHPRWQQMKAERDSLKQQVAELGEVKSKAEVFDRLTGAVQTAGLSAEEFDTGFEIMRQMKLNPMAAMEMLRPFYEQLASMTGHILPDDLQDKVDNGILDQQTASEIALLRTNSTLTKQQLERRDQQDQQRQVQETSAQLASAANNWESQFKKADPDYAKKQPLIQARAAELIQQHGRPRTAEHVAILLNQAKGDVDKYLKGLVPNREPVRTVTGGSSNGVATEKPKSSIDAVRLALNGKYQPQG